MIKTTQRGRLFAIAFGVFLGAGLGTVLAQVSGSGVSSVSNASAITWSAAQTFSQPITVNGANSSIKGPATIAAAASGTALTVNGIAGSAQQILQLVGGASGSAPLMLQDGQTGTRQWVIEAGNPAVGNLRIRDVTAAADRLVINNSGDFTINAPSSGTALTVTGLSGQLAFSASQPVGLPAFTVGTLPTCNTTTKGGMAYVTDASSPTYNAALTGGSSTIVPVFCNGTAWTSH